MCAYGAPYKKMTRLVTSYPPLCSLQRHCHHIRHETQLSGKVQITDKEEFRRHVNRTELAGAYPQNLAETWTSLLEPLLRPCHVEKINTTTDRPLEHFLEHEQPSQTGSFHDKLPLFHTIYRDLPSIQQCIVFGQDSQAVKAQKRKKQERNRPKRTSVGEDTQDLRETLKWVWNFQHASVWEQAKWNLSRLQDTLSRCRTLKRGAKWIAKTSDLGKLTWQWLSIFTNFVKRALPFSQLEAQCMATSCCACHLTCPKNCCWINPRAHWKAGWLDFRITPSAALIFASGTWWPDNVWNRVKS